MGLNLQLEALTVPEGTQFPGTVQGLLNLIAQYESVIGGENFNGVNYGSTEPAAENRDLAWWKTDDSGNPLGWFGWNGSEWAGAPLIIPSGPTASRPDNATVGQPYLDTDIDVMLVWNSTQWVTMAGSPGDVKFVTASTLTEALAKNPGWSNYTDATNRVLVGASDGTGAGERAYGDTWGEEEHTITIEELPSDAVTLQEGWAIFPGQFQNGPQAPGVQPIVTGMANTETTGPINPNTQEAFELAQPSLALWCLRKD